MTDFMSYSSCFFSVNSNLFLNPGLSGEPINNPGLLANGAGNPLLAGSALVGNLGGVAGLNGLSGLGAGAGGSLISGLAGRGGTNILGKCLSYRKTRAHFEKHVLIWENACSRLEARTQNNNQGCVQTFSREQFIFDKTTGRGCCSNVYFVS